MTDMAADTDAAVPDTEWLLDLRKCENNLIYRLICYLGIIIVSHPTALSYRTQSWYWGSLCM